MAETNPYTNTGSGSRLKPIRTDNDMSNLVYGTMQPQAVQIEEVVLGALMLDKDAMAIVLAALSAGLVRLTATAWVLSRGESTFTS